MLNKIILRKYDIRGLVNKNFFYHDAYYIGKAFATIISQNHTNDAINKNDNTCVLGYDGRISSIEFFNQLSNGLIESGIDVISIGLVATPMLYFAIKQFNAIGGIMITGSHNPSEYNGMKITFKNHPFFDKQILELAEICDKKQFIEKNQKGNYKDINISDIYINTIIEKSIA